MKYIMEPEMEKRSSHCKVLHASYTDQLLQISVVPSDQALLRYLAAGVCLQSIYAPC